MSRSVSLLSWLLVLAPALLGQRVWKLPPGSAAVYDREIDFEFGEGARLMPDSLSERLPILFESEIDKDRRRMERGVRGYFSLVPALAFDLAVFRGKPVQRIFWQVEDFGAVVAKARLVSGPVTGAARPKSDRGQGDADRRVTQTLVAEIADDPELERAGGGPATVGFSEDLAALYEWYHKDSFEGSIRIERRFDPRRGVVERFEAVSDVRFTLHSADGPVEVHLRSHETWSLRQIVKGADRGFGYRIDRAIGRAAQFIRQRLDDPNEEAWRREENPGPAIGPALHAQYVRGLGDADVDADDPLLQSRLYELLTRTKRHPRALCESILALQAIYRDSAAHRHALRAGARREAPELPAGARRHLQVLTDALLRTFDREDSSREILRFGHRAGEASGVDWDARVAEAVVAAADLGARVRPAVYGQLARSIIQQQWPAEPRDAVWETLEGGVERATEIAGWRDAQYRGAQPHGFATAAAVAALLALRPELKGKDQASLPALDRSVTLGIAWLAVHFSPRVNPGLVSNDYQDVDEYVEYLPRAMERARIRLLGGRDWYFETGLHLLTGQHPRSGAAGDSIEGTACALQLWLRSRDE